MTVLAERVEIELSNGHRLHVPSRFDAEALARLVEIVGGAMQVRIFVCSEPVDMSCGLLERAGMHNARDESGRRPVGDALRYLRARLSRMDCAGARQNGLRIGSEQRLSERQPGRHVLAQVAVRGEALLANAVARSALEVLVDEAGRSVEVDGTFCGREASELDVELTPRWRS